MSHLQQKIHNLIIKNNLSTNLRGVKSFGYQEKN